MSGIHHQSSRKLLSIARRLRCCIFITLLLL